MKMMKRSTMPDGTCIVLEDWRENYAFIPTFSIACYPILKRLPTSRKLYFSAVGSPFRLELSANWHDDASVLNAFRALETGEKQISDFRTQFREAWYTESL